MRVGIIRFPGSNCDFDTFGFFKKFGHSPEFIWHKETKAKNWDLLVLPGGFAFGDRVYVKATHNYTIDPGELALRSPVMKIVFHFARKDLPVLGICNGFQILVKARLLPGELKQNSSKRFFCDFTHCRVVGKSFFDNVQMINKTYLLPVAHGYGKFEVSKRKYEDLKGNGNIFLEYVKSNPNGSFKNIAGVRNNKGNIFGLMPHPERNPDGKFFMTALEKYVSKR